MKLKLSTLLFLCNCTVSHGLIEIGRLGTVAENAYEDADLKDVDDTSFIGSDDLPDGTVKSKMKKFESKFKKNGHLRADARSGRVSYVNPDAPILPGKGHRNRLLWSVHAGESEPVGDEQYNLDSSSNSGHSPPNYNNAALTSVKSWMTANQEDLDVDVTNELFADGSARVVSHGNGNTIQLFAQRTFKGLRVPGSHAVATVKKGNLIGVGIQKWATIPGDFSVEPKITKEEAAQALADHAGHALDEGETCKPELVVLTLANGKNPNGRGKGTGKGKGQSRGGGKGLFKRNLREPASSSKSSRTVGAGYKPVLVWQVCPKLLGQTQEMLKGYVRADNRSGKVYRFADEVDYFNAMGDVYPKTNDGTPPDGVLQDGWPMPYMTIGDETTTTGGNYLSDTATDVAYDGPYLRMADRCGTASLDTATGLDWGGSAGTDCDTPGFGGAGNTHSSRSGFYELNKIMEIARSHLPNNNWLQQKLISNMNINSSCNAFWNGVSVNFYKSSSTCGNTGEIAAIFDHEWGHGMDANDANGGISSPSGEGIADIYSALRLNDSCIGRGFFKSRTCNNGGNACTVCTGVRDIDYKKTQRNAPSTLTWARANCGTSVHCLGLVYSEAIWNLYTIDLPTQYGYDQNTALELTQRLTYIAAGAVSTWYTNTDNAIPWGGCGSTSGYESFLEADDDDGNIENGTPHMQAIYNAFNRQEIACNVNTVQDSGCAGTSSLVSPIVTTIPGNQQIQLTWTSVPGATAYQVFRTEGVYQCAQGKVVLDTTLGLSYVDTGLQNGREYSYIVIPKGEAEDDSSCFGPSSSCMIATPVETPDIVLECPTDYVTSNLDNAPSTIVRDCIINARGGYTGIVSFSCTSGLTGVSCAGPSNVEFTMGQTEKTVSVTIQVSTFAVNGQGDVTLFATDGTLERYSSIPVTLLSGNGPQVAQFSNQWEAPICMATGSECSSINLDGSSLLKGRGNIGPEANAPNTIDGCADGSAGSYLSDESLEWLRVKSITPSNMKEGDLVTVEAGVWCWNSGTDDWADFYYTTTPSTPNWTPFGSIQCPGGGFQTITTTYTIPAGQADGTNAIRVNFRYRGFPGPCAIGNYNDRDDLVFIVELETPNTNSPTTSIPTNNPTSSPTNVPSISPSHSPTQSPIPLTAPPSTSPSISPTYTPTEAPTLPPTSNPTKSPTSIPTNSPSKSPSVEPTDDPSNTPTNMPTTSPIPAPTKSPTKSPSLEPTHAPSTTPTKMPSGSPSPVPTKLPTTSPTREPIDSPITPVPTKVPPSLPTKFPTSQPTTSPTNFPTTSPTSSPTSQSTSPPPTPTLVVATFDPSLNVPKCSTVGSSCTSGPQLLNGKGSNLEPNAPNTLDSCSDGLVGIYHSDESIDEIKVSTVDGGPLRGGVMAEIEVKIWAWNDGSADTADFYYAANANAPIWEFIGSKRAGGPDLQTLKVQYSLPDGPLQAVRVNFRFLGSQSSCSRGNWDDVDDLVFSAATATAAAGAVAAAKPPSIPLLEPMDSSYCTTIDKFHKDRCVGICEWKNKRKRGCYPRK